jgi:hypothetical protein
MRTGDHVTVTVHGHDIVGKLHNFGVAHRTVIELDEPAKLPSPPFQVTAADGVVRFFVLSDELRPKLRPVSE